MASTEDRAPLILAVLITGTAIATIIVALRFWVRGYILRKVGPDDWVVLASLILSYGSFACVSASCANGLGRHLNTLTAGSAPTALKMLWVAFQITPSSEATAKISITIMLIRVTTSKRWIWFLKTLIVSIIVVTIWTLFAILMSCWPIQLLWDPSIAGHCNVLERTVDIYFQGVIAAAYDVILAIVPIFLLWNIRISRRNKCLVCGLLALGLFTSAAGIARTVYTPDSTKTDDPTFWKLVELPLSIIVGCLPTLRPLLDKSQQGTKGSQRFYDDSYALNPSNKERSRKTTEVEAQIINLSFDTRSIRQPGGEPEDSLRIYRSTAISITHSPRPGSPE